MVHKRFMLLGSMLITLSGGWTAPTLQPPAKELDFPDWSGFIKPKLLNDPVIFPPMAGIYKNGK